MAPITEFIDQTLGLGHPLIYITLFLGASALLIWRLEAMMAAGLEGTAAGALVMPFCSGLGNLLFVFVAVRNGVDAGQVAVNCIGNNLTNLLLILPVVALFFPLTLRSGGGARKRGRGQAAEGEKKRKLNLISLFLTLGAAVLFPLMVWALSLDASLDRGDGLAMIGVFVLWQAFHLHDAGKNQIVKGKSLSLFVFVDAILCIGFAALLLASLDWLVAWLGSLGGDGIVVRNLGWVTAWLMVLPNAALALYYAMRSRSEVVYASQVGDGHICIPLCLGLAATLQPLGLPGWFAEALLVLAGGAAFHAITLALFGGLPRWLALVPCGAYAWCLMRGLA